MKRNILHHYIIGESPEINEAIDLAIRIAKTTSLTTLVTGESGTGKELFAKLIHNSSDDAEKPFIDINCGAIPVNLLESELFGYEKGAFTGADQSKRGLFELANGGTIFLDEIGTTTYGIQAKLLKAVENKKFRRLNGTEEITISSRIIAATNVNLYEEVQNGRFREDLYHRLNIGHIRIPPLRHRKGDALILATYFIKLFTNEYDRRTLGLTPAAEKLIKEYAWPGNVRQLRNAVERAILVYNPEYIDREHLVLDPQQSTEKEPPVNDFVVQYREAPLQFNHIEIPNEGISLETFERDIILSAIKKANGNLSHAARLLKINRGKLRYRIERLQISKVDIAHLQTHHA
ncbi:MAG: sigma-54-dependent Fis family transcriptional regulator [Deferribacteres bacterium]|nr:sigma-54-dependent Fis family transcriptional regulator [candidate division KSB1 bacterium]MCB9503288.1 sigma-54-dependent Fis family transcriptional regulator [Deferribacteres bacterium]